MTLRILTDHTAYVYPNLTPAEKTHGLKGIGGMEGVYMLHDFALGSSRERDRKRETATEVRDE